MNLDKDNLKNISISHILKVMRVKIDLQYRMSC